MARQIPVYKPLFGPCLARCRINAHLGRAIAACLIALQCRISDAPRLSDLHAALDPGAMVWHYWFSLQWSLRGQLVCDNKMSI